MSKTNKTSDAVTINKILKLLRNIEDMSARSLSDKIGLSPSYISEIETGKKEPTLRVLNVYGEFFGISPSNLLYIQEQFLSASNAEIIEKILEARAADAPDKKKRVA